MIPHYDLTIRAKAYRPLMRLDLAINYGLLSLFIVWSVAATQKGWNPYHPTRIFWFVGKEGSIGTILIFFKCCPLFFNVVRLERNEYSKF